ncbi:MAG: hypothetical protein JNL67_02340 [Planctomycetaceae bacterium]|nr:hypothetical protein [Planctomycetaceae bacterium]
MTIAAQHIRAALGHLRSTNPAWKSILKTVGPFTVRIESKAAAWLTHFLPCRTYLEFQVVRATLANVGRESTSSPIELPDPRWTSIQQQFWHELETAQQTGNVQLGIPRSSLELTQRSQALAGILDRFESTILERFQFYCWGELDSWPNSDDALRNVTEVFLENYDVKHTCDNRIVAGQFGELEALVRSWAPYRSIAAWYLERWETIRQATSKEC